jgi:hypothetical protein
MLSTGAGFQPASNIYDKAVGSLPVTGKWSLQLLSADKLEEVFH